ncbi:MAG: hypothetical protein LIP18_00105 [Planctomycetes bacterium]|nr:hypothetical protein [Planctomycetota bacterium]
MGDVDIDVRAHAEKTGRRYRPLPRFPGGLRDISLTLPEAVLWGEVEAVAKTHASLLDSLSFESLYRGKGLKPGMKGMAFSMLLRSPDRSLTDAEANSVRDDVVRALLAAFPGSERR